MKVRGSLPRWDSSHSDRPHWVWITFGNPAATEVGCTLTPLTVAGRRKRLWVESTRTRIESLSMMGTSMGAAEANSTHEKPPAAAPAKAAVPTRNSRRPSVRLMSTSYDGSGGDVSQKGPPATV